MLFSTNEDKIRYLEDELYSARRFIVSQAPARYKDILENLARCRSAAEFHSLEHSAAEDILTECQSTLSDDANWNRRILCPLCGDRPPSAYAEQGFTFPEGLRRHLTGYGNVSQCDVFRACCKLVLDSKNYEPLTESIAKNAKKAERIKTELLYKIEPDGQGQLIDEFHGTPRTTTELLWAEERIVALGFEIKVEDNTKSYVMEEHDFSIFVDPRQRGTIEFRVFPKWLKKKRLSITDCEAFDLRDDWKLDLSSKFKTRLNKVKERFLKRMEGLDT